MKRVYISYPRRGGREGYLEEVSRICFQIARTHETVMPVSPLHMFGFLDDGEPEDREKLLGYCLNLINDCDEVWMFGEWQECEWCVREVNMARLLGKTVRYWGKLE
ncbi:MAG: hypothetical protein HPY66_0996 [Firmicutes bacterium]|nr:hypothetical protein [Bacillota bacterium]